MKPFCDGCGAKVEWHPSARTGRQMPIDPEPVPSGDYYFDGRLRLAWGRPGSRPKMYRCHWDTCRKNARPQQRAFVCNRRGCDITTRHLHCFECGAPDHLAEDCPEAA